MAKRSSAQTVIHSLRSEADYDAALVTIERYFDKPPKPGTPAGDRFDLLARVIDDYERKRERIIHAGVVEEVAQIVARLLVPNIHARLGLLDVAIEPAHAGGEIAAAMRDHDLEARDRVEQALVDDRGCHFRFLDLLADR